MEQGEQPYRELFEAAPDAMVVVGAEGGLRLSNTQCERLFGYPPEALRGVTLGALFAAPKRAALTALLAEFFAAPAPGRLHESSGLRREGEVFPVEMSLSPLRLSGELVAIAALRDISSRKHAEEEATRARTQLDAILACAPSYVFAADLEGKVQFVNRTLRLQRSEYLGVPMFQFMPPEERPRVEEIFRRVVGTKTPITYEIPVPGASGISWFECYMGPMTHGEEIAGVVVISQDITEKKQLESRLLASERMASMGLLAAGVAHEINNPLTAVVASLELASILMTNPLPNAAEIQALLLEVSEGVGRVRAIVQDLRLFSRADDDPQSPTRLQPILESTLRMAQNEIRHRARLRTSYGPAPLVKANESRLGQVFLNLIMNAAQAIPEGHAEDNELRVSLSTTHEGEALLEITDTGVGMSPEVQRRIFEPFFTTKPAGVGTGLGLAICLRLINNVQGRIEVQSTAGKGTSFRVYLPSAAPETPAVVKPVPVPATPQRRAKILVIDDEVSIGTAIRRLLSNEHEVSYLSSGREALAKALDGERFEVILCDVMMAEMNGVEYFTELQRLLPAQADRVIFMTGGAFTPQTRSFLTKIGNPHLEKPFDSLTLRALVNRKLRETSEP